MPQELQECVAPVQEIFSGFQGKCPWKPLIAGTTKPVGDHKKEETHIRVSLLFWSCTFAMQKWSPAGG